MIVEEGDRAARVRKIMCLKLRHIQTMCLMCLILRHFWGTFEAQNEVHSNYVTHVPHFEVQNRGSGAQNQKLPLNISKLEYYGAFWWKIQKLKIFERKPKNHILGGQKWKKPFRTKFLFSFLKHLSLPPFSLSGAGETKIGSPSWLPLSREGEPLVQNTPFPTTGRFGLVGLVW